MNLLEKIFALMEICTQQCKKILARIVGLPKAGALIKLAAP